MQPHVPAHGLVLLACDLVLVLCSLSALQWEATRYIFVLWNLLCSKTLKLWSRHHRVSLSSHTGFRLGTVGLALESVL